MNTEQIIAVGGVLSVGLTIVAYFKLVAPRVRAYVQRKLKEIELQQAMRDVLLGRAAGEPNRVTGEAGAPALPGIAQRLTEVSESQKQSVQKLHEIHEELKAASDKRFKDLEHNVKTLQHQVNQLHKIIAVKAEAEKDLFPAMLGNIGGTNESS